jgi:hypothetical protein
MQYLAQDCAGDKPCAKIIPFPTSAIPIVTVRHVTLGPAKTPGPWWHVRSLEGQRGWAPIVRHANGDEDAFGFFKCEQTAWQEAAALAARRGWRAVRNDEIAARLSANGDRRA